MRAHALHVGRGSIAEVLYPKDSIVVCRACGKPLYRLEASIFVGENAGAASSRAKFRPVSPADLRAIVDRDDLEAGVRAAIKAMSREDRFLHCCKIQPIPAGGTDACPACGQSFVFGSAADTAEGASRFGDRAYVIHLATIPPPGLARRRR